MFTDPPVEPGARQTDIIRIVRTAEHVDINLHRHSGLAPFDRLRVRIEYYLRGSLLELYQPVVQQERPLWNRSWFDKRTNEQKNASP